MSLHLHRAERADTLAAALAEVLTEPLADPFATEIVAVPTQGVERWLAQQLSHRLGAGPRGDGVCAGVAFPSPRTYLADLVRRALGEDEEDPWLPRRATWPLLSAIDEVRGEPWAVTLWRFLGDDRACRPGDPLDPVRSGRRWWTARHLAELYARYATFRPLMIEAWDRGRDTDDVGAPLPPDHRWQAELWRRLRDRLGRPAPTRRLSDAVRALAEHPSAGGAPERLSVFGATRLPADQLRLLAAVAERCEVHLWLPHPSPVLWRRVAAGVDIDPAMPVLRAAETTRPWVQNPLLDYLGRDSQELQLALMPLLRNDPGATDQHHGTAATDAAVLATRPRLLSRLQLDLIADRAPAHGAGPPLLPGDRSVQLHSCHGPDRQVEVLRDVLVGLLADDPTLEPRDIVVMCPDIERFAPLISAAFGLDTDTHVAEHPGHRLRVRLADRSLNQLNPLLAVLARLLDLADGRLTASDLVDFAAMAPVAHRFGFGEDDGQRIAGLVRQSGVRWGLDAAHRAPYGMGAFGQNTWAAGLDRILLGVAMDETGEHSIGTALPLDDLDSSLVDLAGRLAELVEQVGSWSVLFSRRLPVSVWLRHCREAIAALTSVSREDSWQVGHAYAQLARLGVADGDADPELSLVEIRGMLAEQSRGRPTRANFRTGTLTVATLVPMRSVPHRVVCLLGVDDGVFPRRGGLDGDDITALQPRVGDPDRRSEDRQLLLDAVLAATEHLVVVYGGKDPRTGGERPPAAPIGAVLDALDRTAVAPEGSVRDAITRRHALQPFDRDEFVVEGPGPFSFDAQALRGAEVAARERTEPLNPYRIAALAPESEPETTVDLDDLIRFLSHPVRFLLRCRAGLSSFGRDDEIADHLPVEVDALEQWSIGQRLLQAHLGGVDLQRLVAAEWRRGTLPPRGRGAAVIGSITDTVAGVSGAATPFQVGEPESRDIELRLEVGPNRDPVQLVGTVTPLYDHRLLAVGYSKLSARHRLPSWVRLLAVSAACPDEAWRAVTIGRGGVSLLGPVPDRRWASLVLADLVELYRSGRREVVPFTPRTSELYANLRHRDRSIELFTPRLRDQWRQDCDDDWGRVMEPATWEALLASPSRPEEERSTLTEPSRFGTIARRVFSPMLGCEELS